MNKIPIYYSLNEIHEATDSSLRTKNEMFHCFKMSDINMGVNSPPAYRADFFTLALSYGSDNFSIDINDKPYKNLKHFLICIAPGQISSFQKEGKWKGYCTFFKSEFTQYKNEINFLEDYPFFNIQETNLLPVNSEQFENLSLNYQQILNEQQESSPYHIEIMRASFQAILWQVRRIYESNTSRETSDKMRHIITSKFQYLINKHFTQKVLVEQYAELLNITPNHLSQTIKEATGKTAKSLISQRRMEEAKYLLKHTAEDIASIAFYLNFSEPAHFNNFFKKESGLTPLSFRKQS